MALHVKPQVRGPFEGIGPAAFLVLVVVLVGVGRVSSRGRPGGRWCIEAACGLLPMRPRRSGQCEGHFCHWGLAGAFPAWGTWGIILRYARDTEIRICLLKSSRRLWSPLGASTGEKISSWSRMKFPSHVQVGGQEIAVVAKKSLLTLISIAVFSLLAYTRMPPSSRGVMWAEDGSIFLRDAMDHGGLLEIFAPYAGYLHVLPRFAAKFVVQFFAIDNYGYAMNALSCIVVGVVAVLVFHCSQAVSKNIVIRLAFASITVFVAPAPGEALGNFANIHSYLLWLTPWLLLKPATSRVEGIFLFFVGAAIGFTEIVAALFLPMFAIRFRDRSMWLARAGLALGLAFQIITSLLNPRDQTQTHPVDLWSVIMGWFLNSSSALIFGSSKQIVSNVVNYGFWPPLLAAVPFAIALIFIMVKGQPRHRMLAIVLVAGSVAVWGATLIMNFHEQYDYAAFDTEGWKKDFYLSRYSMVPSMFLWALIPLFALCGGSRFRHLAVGILSVFAVLQCIYFFPPGTARTGAPDWRIGVSEARSECMANPALGVSPVEIAPRQWQVEVDCNLLRPVPD